jgi:hypothetical protein
MPAVTLEPEMLRSAEEALSWADPRALMLEAP